jgi:PAS domain S-box-containing protein
MLSLTLVGISVALQFAAAGLAFRMVVRSGRYLAWGLITVALTLMGIRRAISLHAYVLEYRSGSLGGLGSHDLAAELVALAISAAMLAGVWMFKPIFDARERTETQLRASEAKYRGILDNSVDTIVRTDLEGRIDLVSRSVFDLLGYRPEELLGVPMGELHALPGGREKFMQTMAASNGQVVNFEASIRRKSGETIRVSERASYVIGPNGEKVGIQGVIRDITAERKNDLLISRLGRIIDEAANEIYVFDGNTLKFVLVNRGARDNLGYTMAELEDMTPLDIKPEYTIDRFSALIDPLRRRKTQTIEFETNHRRKSGSLYSVQIRLQFAANEAPPLFFAFVEDVTEKKKTEVALRQAQKMEAVGQLTAGVAHDFNNLLTVIVGNLEILSETEPLNDRQRTFIASVGQAANRGTELTRSLLAFARKQPLAPQPLNAAKVIAKMSDLLRQTLGESIDVETVFDSGLWLCEADISQFENALLNLCINARDAMPEGGKLTIEAGNARVTDEYAAAQFDVRPGQYVFVSVTDTGEGIPSEIRDHLFEPFFTTKSAGKGTGLGLSMVYGFVKQSGGNVTVYSEMGEGSTFKIYLPRSNREALEAGPKRSISASAEQGRSIFVVEDDPDLRKLTETMLASLGHRVRSAGSGAEAVHAFEEDSQVDLLLTDVMLPGGMTGRVLADRLRAKYPALRVLYMSGYTENAIIHQGRLDDGVELLQKPFRRANLQEKLLQVLGPENRN